MSAMRLVCLRHNTRVKRPFSQHTWRERQAPYDGGHWRFALRRASGGYRQGDELHALGWNSLPDGAGGPFPARRLSGREGSDCAVWRRSAFPSHRPKAVIPLSARIGIRLGPDRAYVGQSAEAGSFAKADNKVGGRLFDHHGCELTSGC
jgi:hypothetical protein